MRVLVIRPVDRWEESARLLADRGHEAVCAAAVSVVYRSPPELRLALERARRGELNALVFASVTAVKAMAREDRGALLDLPTGVELVAIGPPTAKALRELGAREVAVPSEHTSEGLLSLLSDCEGPVVMLRSDQGNDVLRKGLANVREFQEVEVYSLAEESDGSLDRALHELKEGGIDAVLHTSSYSAKLSVLRSRSLFKDEWLDCWQGTNAAIGPPTRATLESLGVRVGIVPPSATFPELVDALCAHIEHRGK